MRMALNLCKNDKAQLIVEENHRYCSWFSWGAITRPRMGRKDFPSASARHQQSTLITQQPRDQSVTGCWRLLAVANWNWLQTLAVSSAVKLWKAAFYSPFPEILLTLIDTFYLTNLSKLICTFSSTCHIEDLPHPSLIVLKRLFILGVWVANCTGPQAASRWVVISQKQLVHNVLN